ncbi:MAG: hypothetical protein M3R35_02450 [Candidatus Eremiobacteraeota bacterium]|nr:hypothetical protein [Candidatus Eremiobacteraeota bacterium]
MRFLRILAVAGMLAGTAVASAAAGAPRQAYMVAPSSTIKIDTSSLNYGGDVEVHVVGWDRPQVTLAQTVIRGDASVVKTSVDQAGQTLTVRVQLGTAGSQAHGLFGWLHAFAGSYPKVNLEVHVPSRAHLSVLSLNGGTQIENVAGPVSVDGTNGGILVTGGGPSLSIHTTNGAIHASLASAAAPAIDISTTNGGIKLNVPRGFHTRVRTETTNGAVDNPFASANGAGSVKLSTTNGGIGVIQNS